MNENESITKWEDRFTEDKEEVANMNKDEYDEVPDKAENEISQSYVLNTDSILDYIIMLPAGNLPKKMGWSARRSSSSMTPTFAGRLSTWWFRYSTLYSSSFTFNSSRLLTLGSGTHTCPSAAIAPELHSVDQDKRQIRSKRQVSQSCVQVLVYLHLRSAGFAPSTMFWPR